jgi:two-component system, chemotaxis family, protein-glutamate methylesterase/glutaminase
MGIEKVVVVGASMGGVSALKRLVEGLMPGFPAPVLVVLHIGNYPSVLPELLGGRALLPVQHGSDGEQLVPGRIYIAPPDQHMIVEGETVRLNRGPKEHHSRPAIDPLFLSAALSFGPGAIGVVLTGMLDDGTAGLQAIKQCGGIAVVQDPDEAEAPSMPLSALRHVAVDHRVPVGAMGELLHSLAGGSTARPTTPPAALAHEHDLSLAKGSAMEHLNAIGHPSTYACPDCNGTLWQVDNTNPVRYRCHTGHGFSMRSLLSALSETTDTALWGAVRAVQEECMLLHEMAATKRDEGDHENAQRLEAAGDQVEKRLVALRSIVETVPTANIEQLVGAMRETRASD